VLDLLKTITTPEHRPGVALAYQMLTTAGMSFSNFAFWVIRMLKEARRKRLAAWKVWYEYCEYSHTSVERMVQAPRPTFIITDFIVYICQMEIVPYLRLMAKSAAIALLEQLKDVKELGKDRMVKEFLAITASAVKVKPKYTTIWDVTKLLDHIKMSPSLEEQTMWPDSPRVCLVYDFCNGPSYRGLPHSCCGY
jgi:hypothetical protein